MLWCLRTFTLLSLHGQWIVPRSGLIFEKTALDPMTMTLAAKIIMPRITRQEQDADLRLIVDRFEAAGITIEIPAERT